MVTQKLLRTLGVISVLHLFHRHLIRSNSFTNLIFFSKKTYFPFMRAKYFPSYHLIQVRWCCAMLSGRTRCEGRARADGTTGKHILQLVQDFLHSVWEASKSSSVLQICCNIWQKYGSFCWRVFFVCQNQFSSIL